jgi:hypothetical protein
MIAGAAPIDCDQPFRPHITANAMKITAVGMTECISPSTPISMLAAAETIRPVAMKRLMLQ